MKVKLRMMGNKTDGSKMLMNISDLQFGTAIYVEKFPVTKDIGFLTVLEDLDVEKNIFHISIKNSVGELLGVGAKFRSKIISKETGEVAIIYNITQVTFENRLDFYTVELWNNEEIIDTFKLKAESDIYNIYNNMNESGTLSLL